VILIVKSHSGLSRTPFLTALLGAACLALLGGCGQKGPLFMPQQGKHSAATAPIKSTGPAPETVAPVTVEPVASPEISSDTPPDSK
jgi:predicted small lipoprotein YifL